MNLWMVYICNMKSSGKYERWEKGECNLHRWPKSWKICGCSGSFWEFQRHLVDREGQKEKGNYCTKLKKES